MNKTRNKALTFPIRIALAFLIIGILFEIQHWPFSNQIILISGIVISILYTIRFFLKKNKVVLDYVKLPLVMLWVSTYMVKTLHLLNIHYLFNIVLFALFVYWFINEGSSYFSNNRKLKKGKLLKVIYYLLSIITFLLILFGALFKIQHWPYGSEIITLGLLSLAIIIIVDYFLTE